MAIAHSSAPDAVGNDAMMPSPVCLISVPSWARSASRTMALCACSSSCAWAAPSRWGGAEAPGGGRGGRLSRAYANESKELANGPLRLRRQSVTCGRSPQDHEPRIRYPGSELASRAHVGQGGVVRVG